MTGSHAGQTVFWLGNPCLLCYFKHKELPLGDDHQKKGLVNKGQRHPLHVKPPDTGEVEEHFILPIQISVQQRLSCKSAQ